MAPSMVGLHADGNAEPGKQDARRLFKAAFRQIDALKTEPINMRSWWEATRTTRYMHSP
jgi:hypothetical protein